MEPITLCGAVIVVFGLWVEFEAVIMKFVRAINNSAAMAILIPSSKVQKASAFIPSYGYRDYRNGNTLGYRMAKS